MKPTLPQGTRDFGPETVRKRTYILNTIRRQFDLFGFEPLETPAFENLDTLMGKYGEEGDKLIFKILNNGLERSEKHDQARVDFEKILEGKNVKTLTERALKYDLTIPFARYVAMNRGSLTLPFKRYQIQNVWRADRPQRGRYREFTQCDADVVGSKSLVNELELISIYQNVFAQLGIRVEICINNRKILAALAERCGGAAYMNDITVAIDKLDKTSLDAVMHELAQKNLDEHAIHTVRQYLDLKQNNSDNNATLQQLTQLFADSSIGSEGIAELTYIHKNCNKFRIDVTLARGLNYYTGTILEVKPLGIQMGSIGGGGRYDDLTGLFGVPDIPGVGISFGVDRIYDVMEELNLFPEDLQNAVNVLLLNFGEPYLGRNVEIMSVLRTNGISCELYPDAIKFDKQLKYANKKKVAYVIIVGETELAAGNITLKNYNTGEQQKLTLDALPNFIQA